MYYWSMLGDAYISVNLVTIGSGKGLASWGNKALPKLMLTQIYVVLLHCWAKMS